MTNLVGQGILPANHYNARPTRSTRVSNWIGRLLFIGLLAIGGIARGENLLTNGDFAQWKDGAAAHWEHAQGDQPWRQEQVDGRSALRVDIGKAVGGRLGEIRQTVKVQPNTRYRLTAEMKSTRDGTGLIMAKPRAERKELARLASKPSRSTWNTTTLDFDSGPADEVQVLCRYSQKADVVGTSVWFANVKLDLAPAAVTRPAPRPASPPKPGIDQFITPAGAGDKSGRDWTNARPADQLQEAIDAAGMGNTVHIGSGVYENMALELRDGGASTDKPKTIAGIDTGGGLPLFRSNFNKMQPAETGSTLLVALAGASNWVVRDLRVENHRQAIVCRGRHQNVRIENLTITGSRDAIWLDGGALAGQPASGSRNILLRNCRITGFTKRAVRILGGNTGVRLENCHADAGGKEWATEIFPVGFHITDNTPGTIDRDITFIDCTASNNYHDAGKGYWNADGFAAERTSEDVTFIRCAAYNNTDGGWDLKCMRPKLIDCIAIGNKRNFRVWGDTGRIELTNCLSAFATDRGDRGHDLGIWIGAGADATLDRCTFYGSRISVGVDGGKAGALKMTNCLIRPAEGGTAQKIGKGVTVEAPGTIFHAAGSPIELRNPSADWRGGDDAFDSASTPDKGYRYRSRPQ